MSKKLFFIWRILTGLLFLALFLLFLPSKVFAKWADCPSVSIFPGTIAEENTLTIISSKDISIDSSYKVNLDGRGIIPNHDFYIKASERGKLTLRIPAYTLSLGRYEVKLEYEGGDDICRGFITINSAALPGYCQQWTVDPPHPWKNIPLTLNFNGAIPDEIRYEIKLLERNGKEKVLVKNKREVIYTPPEAGDYTFKLYRTTGKNTLICQVIINVGEDDKNPGDGIINTSSGSEDFIDRLCQDNLECLRCFNEENGVWTALGCIPTRNINQFVGWLLGSAIKIAGGIAFLLIIFGAIKILTSAGNPENVKAGQEMITSALMGLLFIIFSLFLLQLIGVKILQIPGFGTP